MLVKRVTFNSKVTIIDDPQDHIELLFEYRRDDFLQRQADKIRMKHLLEPILCPRHRAKIYQAQKSKLKV